MLFLYSLPLYKGRAGDGLILNKSNNIKVMKKIPIINLITVALILII
jgi:hypothetical protein